MRIGRAGVGALVMAACVFAFGGDLPWIVGLAAVGGVLTWWNEGRDDGPRPA